MASAAEILERAAEIAERGWTQGWFARDQEGYKKGSKHHTACAWCAMGAICKAASCIAEEEAAENALRLHLGFPDVDNIVDWNDAPERTQSQVVTAMRDAARKWREEHTKPC